jgi:hypothetical protein
MAMTQHPHGDFPMVTDRTLYPQLSVYMDHGMGGWIWSITWMDDLERRESSAQFFATAELAWKAGRKYWDSEYGPKGKADGGGVHSPETDEAPAPEAPAEPSEVPRPQAAPIDAE